MLHDQQHSLSESYDDIIIISSNNHNENTSTVASSELYYEEIDLDHHREEPMVYTECRAYVTTDATDDKMPREVMQNGGIM